MLLALLTLSATARAQTHVRPLAGRASELSKPIPVPQTPAAATNTKDNRPEPAPGKAATSAGGEGCGLKIGRAHV